MDEQPTTRRGPLLWIAGKSWRFWVVAALLTPLLYVASIGPLVLIRATYRPTNPVVVSVFRNYMGPFHVMSHNSPELVQKSARSYLRVWDPSIPIWAPIPMIEDHSRRQATDK